MSYKEHEAAWRKVGFEHFIQAEGFVKAGHGWKCPVCGDTPGNNRGEHCRVDFQKEVYHCFACESRGEAISGGSYIQVLQAVEKGYINASKSEMIKRIDEIQGVHIDDKNPAPLARDVVSIRRAFVRACLLNKGGNRYMNGRGVKDETLKEFGAGYSDSTELKALQKQGYTEEDFLRAGILRRSSKTGKNYNAFRNRVVVMAGDNIYGRDIRPKEKAFLPHLYTNSANGLYNADRVEQMAGKVEVLYVVESIFDAMSVQQLIKECGDAASQCVVATLGTKGCKDDELVAFVKRIAPTEVVIIPDADPWFQKGTARAHAAGQVAGAKKAECLSKNGIAVRVAVLPAGSDPNDMTAKLNYDGKTFRRLVNDALPILQYRIFCVSHYLDTKTEGGRSAFLNKVRALVQSSKIACSSELYAYIAKLARMEQNAVEEALKGDLMKSQVLQYVRICKSKGLTVEQIAAHLAKLVDSE